MLWVALMKSQLVTLFYFFVIRTHGIYPLKSLSLQYTFVNYRYNAVQQISRGFAPCLTENLCPLFSKSP